MNQLNYTTKSDTNQTRLFRTPFRHFTYKERIFLEDYLRRNNYFNGEKISLSKITTLMKKSKSAISREIKRGIYTRFSNTGKPIVEYLASFANGVAFKKRKEVII